MHLLKFLFMAFCLFSTSVYADEAVVALEDLDPVLLAQGTEQIGEPKFIASDGRFDYQFANEENLKVFENDVDRYKIQNYACPVILGAPISHNLVSVYEGRIYALGTPSSVDMFNPSPNQYIEEKQLSNIL